MPHGYKNRGIQLPPMPDGTRYNIDPGKHQIVIIGANGAGKSRFREQLGIDLDQRAYRISALNALYYRGTPDAARNPTDRMYEQNVAPHQSAFQATTGLERIMALLMHDEMLNLLNYKIRHLSDADASLQPTRLDTVINLWQEIFPDNRILIESGELLFSRSSESTDRYSAKKLSAGERAVIYYLGAMVYAPRNAVVLVDSPDMFLHPTILQSVWNRIETMRPDCTFVYTTHDLDFAASRQSAVKVWVRGFNPTAMVWDYTILPEGNSISEEIYMAILGARKPVLFIEGDPNRSIDAKLYPLIFRDFTIKSLGSCNKVIESTRTFNDLNALHQMDSYGIVDRDRRDAREVAYLRDKKVMVPEVAEVENILMLEEVIRAVASFRGRDEERVFQRVKRQILNEFEHDLRQQALLHTRHRVKRTVEYRIDGKFNSITMLENHMLGLMHEINPRGLYENFCREFSRYKAEGDYPAVLRVYNQKSMLPNSNVAGLCGLKSKEEYIDTILKILHTDRPEAQRIRNAVRRCFNIEPESRPTINSPHRS